MASIVTCEKWGCINDNDELEGIHDGVFSEINGAYLMSLMEELQDHVEENDEERLNSLIQSLEAEINSCTIMDADQESHVEPNYQPVSIGEGSQLFSLEQMINGHNCSVSFDDVDMNGLIDMEPAVPCSPSHEMNNWYLYQGDEIRNGVIGYGGVSTDYSAHTYYGVVLNQEHEYSSLWQDQTLDDSVMYG